MHSASTNIITALPGVAATLLLLLGMAVDLVLVYLWQARRFDLIVPTPSTPPQRLVTPFQVQIVLGVTCFFALAAVLSPEGAPPPQEAKLIGNMLFYTGILLGAVWAALMSARLTFKEAFLHSHISRKRALGLGLLFGVAALPPIALLGVLSQHCYEVVGIEVEPQEVFTWLSEPHHLGVRLFMLASIVIIAPLAEELLFRGILLRAALHGRHFLFAALLNALYFALIHLHAPSFLPLLVLSVVFSGGYITTGSIITPVVMHILFNFASICLYFAALS